MRQFKLNKHQTECSKCGRPCAKTYAANHNGLCVYCAEPHKYWQYKLPSPTKVEAGTGEFVEPAWKDATKDKQVHASKQKLLEKPLEQPISKPISFEVVNFFNKKRINPRDLPNWRMTKEQTGEIEGLPGSRGTLIITNGVMCYIELANGTLFHGHLAWFKPDKKEPIQLKDGTILVDGKPTKNKAVQIANDLLGLIDL